MPIEGLKTVSEANQREHWRTRNARKKKQQASVALAMEAYRSSIVKLVCPLTIVLERCSPGHRPMDSDNLQGSMKHVRDAVAKCLNIDDGDTMMATWNVVGKKAPWGVNIHIHGSY